MAQNSKNKSSNDNGKNLPVDLVNDFLTLQKKEIDVRAQELTVQAKHQENQKDIAKQSIAASLEDRKDDREFRLKKTATNWRGGLVVLAVVILFVGYALFLGKDEIVLELVKIVGALVAGFIGGYGVGKSRKDKSNDENDELS